MRASPCATSVRLIRSRRTTSATVPSATRSSSAPRFGSAAVGECAARAQLRPCGQQHVEHDADAGEMLARKRASGLIRIDDQRGCRKSGGRQMVVGDQHLDAERGCRSDAVVAGDAVVDGHDQPWRLRRRPRRRSPASVHSRTRTGSARENRRWRPSRRARAPSRAGGGAVGVVVGDDHDLLAGGAMASASRVAAASIPFIVANGGSVARSWSSSSGVSTPRAAKTRASTGCTPEAASVCAAPGNSATHDVHQSSLLAPPRSAVRSRR